MSGDDILPWLDALARLRIQVFREWPYLYDGDESYERRYLQTYADASQGLMVLALSEGQVVGASSGLPMADADAAFQAPFRERGIDVAQVFYFGESVLDSRFRGQGLGHLFFDQREDFARRSGYAMTTFCAVQRPADHPARPAGYRPLDRFWQGRGYCRQEGMLTRFSWQDIGESGETAKPMQYWTRGL